jgi:CspA family cold shock protein
VVEFLKAKKQNINMSQGTIKTLTDRGFGFIAREGEAKDLFFHAKELSGVAFDDLKVGDAVTFEVVEGDKGPSATNVARA